MSPVPIIARQRALSRVGEIRIGAEKQNGKVGRKLDTFRLTSQQKDIVERCAELYGGKPRAWASPAGDSFQLITERSALPVLVIVGYSLKLLYEKWEGATKCTRRCDGEEEHIAGVPCICNASGKDECGIVTRLMVVLPETGTSLGWQLRSIGENAANELAGAMVIAEELARGRSFVPAQLRLTQRRGLVGEQVVRYVVPVLDFNPQQPAIAPVDGELTPAALPTGYKPVAELPAGVSLEQGLQVAQTQERKRTARSSPSLPSDDVFGDEQTDEDPGAPPSPQAVPTIGAAPPAAPQAAPEPEKAKPPATASKPLTKAQGTKLNVLVGTLRDTLGVISTEQLYSALATSRNVDVEVMIELMEARDDTGELHYAPLRDTLTLGEASDLIERLQRLEDNQPKAAA